MGQHSPLRAELEAKFGRTAQSMAAEFMALLDEVVPFNKLFDWSIASLGVDDGYNALFTAGGRNALSLVRIASEAYLLTYAFTLPEVLGQSWPCIYGIWNAHVAHIRIRASSKQVDQVDRIYRNCLADFVECEKRKMLCTLSQLYHLRKQMSLLMTPGVIVTATSVMIPGISSPAQLPGVVACHVLR